VIGHVESLKTRRAPYCSQGSKGGLILSSFLAPKFARGKNMTCDSSKTLMYSPRTDRGRKDRGYVGRQAIKP
jgi:hypothetical protein